MNSVQSQKIFDARIDHIRALFVGKAEEYAESDNNRLSNFDRIADINGNTPEQALWGMAVKHLGSILDFIDGTAEGKCPTKEQIDEKFSDMIGYFLLLEAVFHQRLDVKDWAMNFNLNAEEVQIVGWRLGAFSDMEKKLLTEKILSDFNSLDKPFAHTLVIQGSIAQALHPRLHDQDFWPTKEIYDGPLEYGYEFKRNED